MENLVKGKVCIIRADRAGVFVGEVMSYDPKTKDVALKNFKRIQYWNGIYGGTVGLEKIETSEPIQRISQSCELGLISNVIEIFICTETAKEIYSNLEKWV